MKKLGLFLLALGAGLLLSTPIYGANQLKGQKAPEITPRQWLNSAPTSLAKLKGKVVFLEFFSTG